ncbi:MAG: hypothetical protein JNG83_04160 [Opitutaceae bacterium]|nr:hypothetical protein [Opitutaceae bacterium]
MRRPRHASRPPAPGYRERGAVLVVTLLIVALIAIGLGAYLNLNLSTARLARQSYHQNASFHLAEAGAEEAVWSFNRATAGAPGAWDGWTAAEPAAWRKFAGFDFGAGTAGFVKVYVSPVRPAAGAAPTVVALAQVQAPGQPASSRMIQVTLGRRSFFAGGLVARESVRFAGLNASVDSWNSDPDRDPATAPVPYSAGVRRDGGTIATMAVQNNAMLINQAAVWGYVATGGAAPEVGVHGSIRGADTPPDVQIDPARVSTSFAADLPVIRAPLDGTPIAAIGATLGVEGEATRWRCPRLALRGNDTLTILGDVTLILTATTGSALEVSGGAAILVPAGSSLQLYVEADVAIAGKGLGNANARPVTCRLWGTSTSAAGQRLQVAGNGALKAVIYAPNAEVMINGNGDVMGAVVGRTITLNGNAAFHYDESLAEEGDHTPYKVTRWRELTDAADRARWLPVFAGW